MGAILVVIMVIMEILIVLLIMLIDMARDQVLLFVVTMILLLDLIMVANVPPLTSLCTLMDRCEDPNLAPWILFKVQVVGIILLMRIDQFIHSDPYTVYCSRRNTLVPEICIIQKIDFAVS